MCMGHTGLHCCVQTPRPSKAVVVVGSAVEVEGRKVAWEREDARGMRGMRR